MPDLPTRSVTTKQAQRILAVFGTQAGYLKWLSETLREKVLTHEARAMDEQHNATKRAALAVSEDELTGLADPKPGPLP